MEEKIYTIPVNEAVNGKLGCPLCRMRESIEEDYVKRTLGGAMMEPSERIKTNEKGFCKTHYKKLHQQQQILPLALILDTHINTIQEAFSKKQPFTGRPDIRTILNQLQKTENSCYICEKIERLFSKYIDTFFLLWKQDEVFQNKCIQGDGYCLEHYLLLLKESEQYLPKKLRSQFCETLTQYQADCFNKLSEDVHWFCQKFNYQNADAPWDGAENAPVRALEKLGGGFYPKQF